MTDAELLDQYAQGTKPHAIAAAIGIPVETCRNRIISAAVKRYVATASRLRAGCWLAH